MKLLWLLLFRTESIWVVWIHQNVIKNESIWEMKEKRKHTWLFKKIMRLRDVIHPWIIILPGNGRKSRFWYDSWTPFGPLLSFIGEKGPRLTGVALSAIVASVWHSGGWTLKPARSPRIEELLDHLTTISLSDT